MRIRSVCNSCGGFDYCDISGAYVEKHECQFLNTNQLLLRIATALENIEKKLK
jgi:hypothetical protein